MVEAKVEPNISSIRIRPMGTGDYDRVIALWRATDGVGPDASDEREPIVAYLARNPDLSQVAIVTTREMRERVVGAVLCGFDGRRGDLCHLAVDKEFRGRGIGRRLIVVCLKRLQEVGMLKCNIRVFANNREGQAFWRHLDFALREDLVVMQRRIG